jgi:hypothetical protein
VLVEALRPGLFASFRICCILSVWASSEANEGSCACACAGFGAGAGWWMMFAMFMAGACVGSG